MRSGSAEESAPSSILIVDGDIISRRVIADYLRHCAYAVVEAANTDEAILALLEPTLSIDVILCDVSALGSRNGLELATWVQTNRLELEVRLAAGAEVAAQTAAELCESSPHFARPYEAEVVVDYIKRLRTSRSPKVYGRKSEQPADAAKRRVTGYVSVGIIERAYQLASESHSLVELRSKLKKEGYSDIDDHLAGGGIRKDLGKLYKREEER